MVLSVTEGEDKPLKYPGIFRKAELMILNKIDLLPYVPFKPELARENARRIHPDIEIIETSCTTGAGFDQWMSWLAARAERKKVAAALAGATVSDPEPTRRLAMLTPEIDVGTALARRGITRRQLVKFCSAMLGTLALPERYLAQTVAAVGKARKPVLVWLQFQDCTGCSESMLRSSHPDVADVVLDLLSWEYHEVIMAGAGEHANAAARSRRERRKRQVSGGGGGRDSHGGWRQSTAPSAATPRMEIAEKVCRNAAATIAVGACAFDGGLVRSKPESHRRARRAGSGARASR